jgi:hypothetical protein
VRCEDGLGHDRSTVLREKPHSAIVPGYPLQSTVSVRFAVDFVSFSGRNACAAHSPKSNGVIAQAQRGKLDREGFSDFANSPRTSLSYLTSKTSV